MQQLRFPRSILLVGLMLAAPMLAFLAPRPALAAHEDEDHRRTKSLLVAFERAPNWVVKAMVLSSLGSRWHPEGNRVVLEALRSKDKRLQAFGLEALRGTAPENVPPLLTSEMLDELITVQLKKRNKFFRAEVRRLLMKALPQVANAGGKWGTWWAHARETYHPPAWNEARVPGTKGKHETVARRSVAARALELSQDGIELVLVFDSTGSMQPTIDAARRAMRPVIEILRGLSPGLRVGLVHYRDRSDLGGKGEGAGAKVRSKLTGNLGGVQRHLDKLKADGGGDIPERVYGGLWLALHREMGWSLPACKMVVVVGDAPPHPEDVEPSIQLVKEAHKNTAWRLARNRRGPAPVVTGGFVGKGKKKKRVRPIFTSTVWTGPDPGKKSEKKIYAEWAQGARHFEAIAKAGGGVSVILKSRGNPKKVSAGFVTHLVGLTFGVEHQEAAKRLAERYIYWKAVGFLK